MSKTLDLKAFYEIHVEPVTHGPEFWKSPYPCYYHFLPGELSLFSRSLHFHSPQLTQRKLLSPCAPLNLQISPVLPTELPCISSREKKKEKEDNLSWINRCFVFDSARCHSTLSGPLSFFFSQELDFTCSIGIWIHMSSFVCYPQTTSTMQHCLDPLFSGLFWSTQF